MMDYPILFTGKDVHKAPRPAYHLERARDRAHQKQTERERIKREEARRDEEFYYEMADISPVQVMSGHIATLQEDSLDEYNSRWADVYAEQGGVLTSVQQSQMFRERKSIEAKQAQWLGSQNMYERDYEMYKRDTMRLSPILDHDHFLNEQSGYFETGVYSGKGLQYAPLNPSVYFTKNRLPGSGDRTLTSEIVGGREITTETRVPGTKEESDRFIKGHIDQDMMGTGRLTMGVVKDFMDQPDEVKEQYLVEGEVDTEQEQNAVITWAQDYYEKDVRRVTDIKKDEEIRPRAGSSTTKPTPYELIDGVIYDRIGNEIMRKSDGVSGSAISSGQGYEISDKVRTLNVDAGVLYGPGGKSFEETFGGLPETEVRVRPEVMTGGEVQFLLAAPVKIERKVGDEELTRDIIKKAKVKDGDYYITETIPTGTPVGAYIKDIETDLANTLGGDALKNATEGLDPYAKYKE